MHSTWMIGPLMIPVTYVVVTLSLVIGGMYVRYFTVYKQSDWKDDRETSLNALFIAIFVFFFGSIVFQWRTFFQDPLPAIAYPSSQRELLLGFGVAVVYLIIIHIRKKRDFLHSFSILFYLLLVAQFVYAFFAQKSGVPLDSLFIPVNKHPISLYEMLLSGTMLFLLHKRGKELRLSRMTAIFSAWAFGQWLITMADPTPQFFFVYMSSNIYLYLTVGSVVIALALYYVSSCQSRLP